MDHKLQHGLRWLHKPLTSAWLLKAAKPEDITQASAEAQAVYVHPHGSQASLRPLVILWSNPESEPYLIAGLLRCLELGG